MCGRLWKIASVATLMAAALALCLQISGCSSSGNPAGPGAADESDAPPPTEPEAPPPGSVEETDPPPAPGGEPEPDQTGVVGTWVGLVTIPTEELTLKFSVQVSFKADGSFSLKGPEGMAGSGTYALTGTRLTGSGTTPGMEPGTTVRVTFEGTVDGDRITGDWHVGTDYSGTFRFNRA